MDAGDKHLNVRIYLVSTTKKLQYTDTMNWSTAFSGQVGCKIIFDNLMYPKVI